MSRTCSASCESVCGIARFCLSQCESGVTAWSAPYKMDKCLVFHGTDLSNAHVHLSSSTWRWRTGSQMAVQCSKPSAALSLDPSLHPSGSPQRDPFSITDHGSEATYCESPLGHDASGHLIQFSDAELAQKAMAQNVAQQRAGSDGVRHGRAA